MGCRNNSAVYELCCTGCRIFLMFDTMYARLTESSLWAEPAITSSHRELFKVRRCEIIREPQKNFDRLSYREPRHIRVFSLFYCIDALCGDVYFDLKR